MKLVDKEKLLGKIANGEANFKMKPGGILHTLDILSKEKLTKIIENSCTLSPAELAGILGGKAWVLEELKDLWDRPSGFTLDEFKQIIKDLESQAPAELAEFKLMEAKAKAWDETIPPLIKLQKETKVSVEQLKKQITGFVQQAKEDRRKAAAWDAWRLAWRGALELAKQEAKRDRTGEIMYKHYLRLDAFMDQAIYLAQSDKPKAEEKSDEENSGD